MTGPIVPRVEIEREIFRHLEEGATSDQAVECVASSYCLPVEAVESVIEDLEEA
ncbi:hypothetical protein [Roseateles aquatilis]|uniref:hypothetical protein n=1 Tax=Roseateles aquatilis TaxID=431061 RepID=UPI001303369C|nr:hypothetical protein [Roseateles aquatilis]